MILNNVLIGKNIQMRSATTDDAQFILDLRLDPELKKFINETSSELQKQKEWIDDQRKKNGDYYFMIMNNKEELLGTAAAYDIINKNFNVGRWIVKRSAPKTIAVESLVMVYNFGFNILKLSTADFQVRTENIKGLNFHLSYGCEIYKISGNLVHLKFKKTLFNDLLKKFKNYHNINII